MEDKDIETLVNKLIDRTKAKQLQWDKTARESEFVTKLSSGSITSGRLSDTQGDYYDIGVYNNNGDKIFDLEQPIGGAMYGLLASLNEAARGSFYKVDEIINILISELDSPGAINAPTLSIIRAKYGAGKIFNDVTEILRSAVKNGRLRIPAANDSLGGDPIFGQPKQLMVEYSHDGKMGNKTVNENYILELP